MKETTYDAFFYKALGEILVKERQSRSRTFEDVAFVLGVPPITFYKWENGARKIPLNTLKKLCTFYNLKINDVLDGAHEKAKEMINIK